MYVRVYAPNGEPFDVSRDRADTLILENGWTQTAPVAADAEAAEDKSTRRRARRKDDEVEASVEDVATDSV